MFQATLSGLAVGSLFALIAVGFNLTFIVNRTVNFAHGQWVAVGSLLAFTLLVRVADAAAGHHHRDRRAARHPRRRGSSGSAFARCSATRCRSASS